MTGHGAYLAHPIDAMNAASARMVSLRAALVSRSLQELSWVFDPGEAFSVAPKAAPVPSLRSINMAALDQASILIAILPSEISSIGVPMEIERAVSADKPVVLITDRRDSWALQLPLDAVVFWVELSSDPTEVVDRMPCLREMIERTTPIDPGTALRKLALPVQIFGNLASLPTFSYNDDAGLDLIVSQDTVLPPGQFTDIPNGIAVEIPEDCWGLICGRSSTLRKLGLMIPFGVIDAGYRGPLFAGAWNMNQESVVVSAGSRVSQLILVPNETRRYYPVGRAELTPSPRGLNGFGSTGS